MTPIVFYISGHGFGHASRCIEVINALLAREPALELVVKTTAPRWLFDLTVRGRFEYQHTETDTGIVQIDSLRLDAGETLRRARAFLSTFDERLSREATDLADRRAALVVSDLPPLGIAAAVKAGVPAVAYGNFTWDWIYSGYSGSDDVVDAIGSAYAGARVALRLPMWGGFARFPDVIDLPFVARRSSRDPEDTRHALGLPASERLVLISFGGYGLPGLDLTALDRLQGYRIVATAMTAPARAGRVTVIDEAAMYDAGFRYEDLVRAVDVVATKPGYGIIADCVANDTALLYTSRGHFVEYDVLVAAMPRFLRAAFIDHADLFAGRWQPHLDALVAQPPPPERPSTDGAAVAADLLLRSAVT